MTKLSNSEINLGFRRMRGTKWATILARIAVYGVRPYEAFTGYVSGSHHFVIYPIHDKPARVIPPMFYLSGWLDLVTGFLPNISVNSNREYSCRLGGTLTRYDVPFTASQLRKRWELCLKENGYPDSEIAVLMGIKSWVYAKKNCSQDLSDVDGCVYVIRHLSTGLYKIGVTRQACINDRLKQLKVGINTELVDLIVTANYRAVEKSLHKKFSAYRLPQTEYFQLDDSHVNTIFTHATC